MDASTSKAYFALKNEASKAGLPWSIVMRELTDILEWKQEYDFGGACRYLQGKLESGEWNGDSSMRPPSVDLNGALCLLLHIDKFGMISGNVMHSVDDRIPERVFDSLVWLRAPTDDERKILSTRLAYRKGEAYPTMQNNFGKSSLALAPTRCVPSDVTVVCVLDSCPVEEFQANFSSWRTAFEGTPKILLGREVPELRNSRDPNFSQDLIFEADNCQYFALRDSRVLTVCAFLNESVKTRRIIFLSPTARALPGAHLSIGDQWENCKIGVHKNSTRASQWSEFTAIVSLANIKQLVESKAILEYTALPRLLEQLARIGEQNPVNTDLEQWGWRM